MKKILIITAFLGLVILAGLYAKQNLHQVTSTVENPTNQRNDINKEFREGDLIFQTSLSSQSQAIQLATKSKYSHCAIILKKEGDNQNWYVFEAVNTIKWTPLYQWIARGKNSHFVVKRLKNADKVLTNKVLTKIKKIVEQWNGKKYDLAFEWSDSKIYCSELIWKIYQRTTNITIGKLEKLKDFDFTNPVVKAKLKERYGNDLPLNEIVISPKAIFDSELLMTVQIN